MTKIFLDIFRSRLFLPKRLFIFGIRLISKVKQLGGSCLVLDESRFIAANWPGRWSFTTRQVLSIQEAIEVVIVSTRKDFDTLPVAITYANRALASFEKVNFTIIVPPIDLTDCERLVQGLVENISVISEWNVVGNELLESLKVTFKSRATWIYQQILKTWYVRNSVFKYSLILDSDTILLRPRRWLTDDGKQILMPSDEFNEDYYLFLSEIGICPAIPTYTFISHHMIMQPAILREILQECSFERLEDFVSYIIRNANLKSNSPICVEYELYGQYLFSNMKDFYFLEKWRNVGISRSYFAKIMKSDLELLLLKLFYDSVSFHSWSVKSGG